MAFRHFNNQKSTIGNHQSKGFPNSMQSAWRATLGFLAVSTGVWPDKAAASEEENDFMV